MSDIQPSEANREEARLFLNRLSHIYEEPDDIDTGPEEEMINAILEYRADAVKAEREKIAILEARIAELTKPYKPIYSEPKAYVSDGPGVDSYLSDDQEPHRG